MKYIIIALILLPCLYTFSYAKYSWDNKKRMAAMGAVFISFISIVLPAILLFLRR